MIIEDCLGIDTNELGVRMATNRQGRRERLFQALPLCNALGISNTSLAVKKLPNEDRCKQVVDFQFGREYENRYKQAWFVTEWGAIRLAAYTRNRYRERVFAWLQESERPEAKAILDEIVMKRTRVRGQ